jgi:hypothetical protein
MSSTLSTSETRINNQVAQLFAKLPNDLEPDALLSRINVPTMRSKGDLDNDTLGHAYYTLYYGLERPRSSVKPVDISLLKLYQQNSAAEATSATAAINVVKQTDPAVYVASVCDAILPYTLRIIPAPLFCQVIQNVHPHELKNDYYHNQTICGSRFDEYLEMVNARLQEYFTANRVLDDVLSGIKKCLCLRILSNNMYHYRDNPAGLDPAIQKLMRFYTRTDFLHVSSQERFDSHAHMVRKYHALKRFIDKVLELGPSFMSNHYFTFGEITHNLDLGLFDRLYDEPAYFSCANFPQCITDLKRNISADDILFSMQLHSGAVSYEKNVENGLILLQFLVNRIKQDNALSLNTTDDYDVAHEVFQMTGQSIEYLNLAHSKHARTLFAKFDKEIFDMISGMPLSKRKKVLPLPIRIHSTPFQALPISPHMFRARNIPYGSGSVSVHRASPPSVHRASPPSIHRASPPPPRNNKRSRSRSRSPSRSRSRSPSRSKKRPRGGAKSKTRRSKTRK